MTDSGTSLNDTGAVAAVRRRTAFRRILASVMQAGRGLLALNRADDRSAEEPAVALCSLCQELLDHRGEAAGLALAGEILSDYQALSTEQRVEFFELLSERFEASPQVILDAADAYRAAPRFETLSALAAAVESPRRELLRRLNMVPHGTAELVRMRGQLLSLVHERPAVRPLESDLRHLLTAWFNRGFLVMDRIDWSSSANVLEKIIAYEAVHEINGWDDLRTRLAGDRRCFAFFHPAMPDDPLIFVQVALTDEIARSIEPLIARNRLIVDDRDADSAVFYSISNCHDGLRGISFGHFLIKQVIEELRRDLDNVKRFATLSPVPGLCRWITNTPIEALPQELEADLAMARRILDDSQAGDLREIGEDAEAVPLRLCAYYLLEAKADGEPIDPVARFHLGNGASLERINWLADSSRAGIERSAGIMVNYVYRLKDIEKNHELYFADGTIVAAAAVRKLLQAR
jgi:malonyl-CoA decarboxylase